MRLYTYLIAFLMWQVAFAHKTGLKHTHGNDNGNGNGNGNNAPEIDGDNFFVMVAILGSVYILYRSYREQQEKDEDKDEKDSK